MSASIAALEHQLATEFAVVLECAAELPSSNSTLMERGRNGGRRATLLWVEHQTAGRGRGGRTWHTQSGQALTFSLGFSAHFRAGLHGLSLAIGLAAAEALDPLTSHRLQLKWPNDLYLNERKLGGILVETLWQEAQPWVVIGIGLNICAPAVTASSHYRRAPACWQECESSATSLSCLSRIAPALCASLQQFTQHGLTPLLPQWHKRDALWQRSISLQQDDQTLTGIAQGINTDGTLRLATAQGIQFLHAAEVTSVSW